RVTPAPRTSPTIRAPKSWSSAMESQSRDGERHPPGAGSESTLTTAAAPSSRCRSHDDESSQEESSGLRPKLRFQPPGRVVETPQGRSGPQLKRRKQAIAAGLAGARHAGVR